MRKAEVILPLRYFSDLDRTGPIPLYYQLSQRIEQAIHTGKLSPGDRMENEVSLGERLGLSRPTVRRAIEELVAKGFVVRRRGIGTQVVHGQVARGIELTSLYDDLVRLGKKPQTNVLEVKLVPAETLVAEQLGIRPGEDVVFIHRVRLSGKTPVAIMQNWLPTKFMELKRKDMEKLGLYEWLRTRGTSIHVAKQKIAARRATHQESDLLELEKSDPVLTMDRTAYDNSGAAVEFGHHCYRTDLYSFEFTLVDR